MQNNQEQKLTPPQVLQNTLKVLLVMTDDSGLTILEKLLVNKLTKEDIIFLNNNESFPNTGATPHVDKENYDDQNFKTTIAVQDFVNFISPYLTDQQLFHLVEQFIPFEMLESQTAYRNMNLAKALMLEAVKRHDPSKSITNNQRNLPSCLLFHFQHMIKCYGNKNLDFNMFINFNFYGAQTNQIECYQPVNEFNSSTFDSNTLSNQSKKLQNSCLSTAISLIKLDLNDPQTFANVCCLNVEPKQRKQLRENIMQAFESINQHIEIFNQEIKTSVVVFFEAFEKIDSTTACENFLNNQSLSQAFKKLLAPCIERIKLIKQISQQCQGISKPHLNQLLQSIPCPNNEMITRAILLITQGFETLIRLEADEKLFETFMQQAQNSMAPYIKYLNKSDKKELNLSLEKIFKTYEKRFCERQINNFNIKTKSFCEFINNRSQVEENDSSQPSNANSQLLPRSSSQLKPTNNRSFFSFNPVDDIVITSTPKNIRRNTTSLIQVKVPEKKEPPLKSPGVKNSPSNQVNTQSISFNEELQTKLDGNQNNASPTKFKIPGKTIPLKKIGKKNSLINSSNQSTEESNEKSQFSPLLPSLVKQTVRQNSNRNQVNTSDTESLQKSNSQNNLQKTIVKNSSNPNNVPKKFTYNNELNIPPKTPPKKGALPKKTIIKKSPPNKTTKNPTNAHPPNKNNSFNSK